MKDSLVDVADEIVAAVQTLSRHRYGAVVLWNPAIAIAGGVVLDAVVSRQLLVGIFTPESTNELRTGVTVIRGPRLERAAVPIALAEVVERAAELAAGVAIKVDEDTSEIRTIDRAGRIEVVDMDGLASALHCHALDAGRLAR